MRKLVACSLLALTLFGCAAPPPAPPAEAPAQILLVRHAEKDGEDGDVPLSEQGHARARELARTLADAGVSAIYTSQFERNVDTAKPLAETLNIQPTVIPADDIQVLVDKLKASPAGSTTLVVSHQNKLPQLVAGLGAETPALTPTEYDRLVVVTLGAGKPKALTLRYGAPSELAPE
ncbi:MAG: hypothetical protein GC160_02055 [Acidobacteria bacterium]|nr:hypothetical protein [Acidobacteriota bacterium]